jgi:hypothetical protein
MNIDVVLFWMIFITGVVMMIASIVLYPGGLA